MKKNQTAIAAALELRDEMIGAAQILEQAAKRLREDSRILLANARAGQYDSAAAIDHFRDFKILDARRAGENAAAEIHPTETERQS